MLRRGILIPSGGTTLINHAYATIKVSNKLLRFGQGMRTKLCQVSALHQTFHHRTSTQVLRETLGCMLPIEIVFNGEREMDKRTCAKFEACPDLQISAPLLLYRCQDLHLLCKSRVVAWSKSTQEARRMPMCMQLH